MRKDNHLKITENDDEVRLLVEEREDLKWRRALDEKRWKEINDALKELMGDATFASLPGWRLEIQTQNRKEYIVPARVVRALYVRRDFEDEE